MSLSGRRGRRRPRAPCPPRPPAGTQRDPAAGRLGGLDPEELAGRDGTPFYAYDLDVVGRQVDGASSSLPTSVDLAYAVKANPALPSSATCAGSASGADVASGGELRQALRAGFVAGEVVVTGPGKRDEELAAAVDAGVRAVTVESPGELRRLATIAEGLGPHAAGPPPRRR